MGKNLYETPRDRGKWGLTKKGEAPKKDTMDKESLRKEHLAALLERAKKHKKK